MGYKRFTEWSERYKCYVTTQERGSIGYCDTCESIYAGESIDRLAELEDAIEQGKMIELPCKVGDTVYIDERCFRHTVYYNHIIVGSVFFAVGRVTSIRITKKQILVRIKVEYKGNPFSYKVKNFPIGAIGKTVFFTREEAEKKLKELQE